MSEFSSVFGAWQGSADEGCYCHFIIVPAMVPHPQSVWTHQESVSCDSWDAGESPGGQAMSLPPGFLCDLGHIRNPEGLPPGPGN